MTHLATSPSRIAGGTAAFVAATFLVQALSHFVVAVDLVRGPRAWPEFVGWYREMAGRHGRPDFTT